MNGLRQHQRVACDHHAAHLREQAHALPASSTGGGNRRAHRFVLCTSQVVTPYEGIQYQLNMCSLVRELLERKSLRA